MSDELIKALMARPVMPEEFDKPEALGPATPHLRAFGAGLIDPAGIPSWIANLVAHGPKTDWYERRMKEARDESPTAAGLGSAVLPTLIGGPLLGGTAAETMQLLPHSLAMGGSAGSLKDLVAPVRNKRPQGSYPPGGAY